MKCLMMALAALAAAGTGARQMPAETAASASRVRIDAVAVDRHGNPVTDLKQTDIEVWIGIYRVPIESLTVVTSSDESGGRVIVLVLDDVTIEPALAPRVKDAARRFVSRMLPGDRLGIVALNGGVTEITDDPARLRRAIDAYGGYSGGVMRIDDLGAQVLKTLESLSRHLAETPGRKTIVGLGAGWLFDTPIPPPGAARDLRAEWTAAVRAMAAGRTSLYAIDPGGLGRSPFIGPSSGFARETGGHAFVTTNDVNGAVDQILREASNYYVIQVADPPVGRNAELRELDVRVLRRGVTVRARRWLRGGK